MKVFKKVSRDQSLTVYMDKRDFVDRCDSVQPVDGVIVVDPQQLRGRKVYVMLSCTFKYGRQDMDVMGVAFRRDLFVVTRQVYPELQDKEQLTHTKVQQRLLQKPGDNAFPFFFEFPDNLPCSVALQPGPSDVGKVSAASPSLRLHQNPALTLLCARQKCAVEFEVKGFCGQNQDDRQDKQSSVRLSIRKVQFSPADSGLVPVAETTFEFVMSEKPLHVRLSLAREVRGEGLSTRVPSQRLCPRRPSTTESPSPSAWRSTTPPAGPSRTSACRLNRSPLWFSTPMTSTSSLWPKKRP
ncbi:unnamed protein product, partial [Tetraodon nigroviridis]